MTELLEQAEGPGSSLRLPAAAQLALDDGTCNQAVEIVGGDMSLPLTRKKAESKDEAA